MKVSFLALPPLLATKLSISTLVPIAFPSNVKSIFPLPAGSISDAVVLLMPANSTGITKKDAIVLKAF